MADISGTAGMPVEGRIAEGSPPADPPVLVGLDDGTNIINAQANAAGALKVASDAGAADFLKLVDSVAGGTDAGIAMLAVRDDEPPAITPAVGDYAPLLVGSNGCLWTSLRDQVAGNSLSIDNPGDATTLTGRARVTAATYLYNGTTFDRARGDITNGQDVDVTRVDGGVNHDAADSGGPVKIGGRADSTEQADVADGDRVDALFTLGGKIVNHPYSVPERLVQGDTASITGTADTSVIAAPGVGLRNYITSILVTNGHASVGTYVNIKDGTTTIYTGYAREDGGGFSVTLPSPLRLTANTVLNAANETTGSDTRVSASGFIAP